MGQDAGWGEPLPLMTTRRHRIGAASLLAKICDVCLQRIVCLPLAGLLLCLILFLGLILLLILLLGLILFLILLLGLVLLLVLLLGLILFLILLLSLILLLALTRLLALVLLLGLVLLLVLLLGLILLLILLGLIPLLVLLTLSLILFLSPVLFLVLLRFGSPLGLLYRRFGRCYIVRPTCSQLVAGAERLSVAEACLRLLVDLLADTQRLLQPRLVTILCLRPQLL